MRNLTIILLSAFVFVSCSRSNYLSNKHDYDIIIYGATPSGIAAAVNAASEGMHVALFEETDHIGGLTSGGLSNTDFLSFESLGGTWRDFMNGVVKHYADAYGENSQQVKDCWNGAYYEPKVARQVFMDMLGAYDKIVVKTNHRVVAATTILNENQHSNIKSLRLKDLETQQLFEVTASVFIDATYEGDLMAKAGCAYTLGSEGPEMYNEPAASQKDWHVQCYNFRVTLCQNPENSIPIPRPENYDSTAYELILNEIEAGSINTLRDIIRGQNRQIPNGKADFNDRKGSPISIKLCNETDVWPEGAAEVRAQIWEKAKNHTLGILYFLQNDSRLPGNIQSEMQRWNLPRDEFEEYGNFPPVIYVREGRRLIGRHVFTQHDGTPDGSVRAPAFHRAIAIGDYNFNSHGTYYTCDKTLLGNLGAVSAPFQVPFGVLLPKRVDNLLVSVAVSASRVGFGALRMEPTWTALGQAAGLAAALSVQSDQNPHEIDITELQRKLHQRGAYTFYTSDVTPESPYFEAIQFLGNRGLFQDMYPVDKMPKRKFVKLSDMAQWTEAYPLHDVKPEITMDNAMAEKWMKKLNIENQNLLNNAPEMTRGDFLNELCNIYRNKN